MPAKMLTSITLTLLVGQHGAERLEHAVGAGAAADVEEVRGLAPASLIMSIVAMARPAPLMMQPMSPSRPT
jgi:AmiR/NasT family two-component response regulator